MTMRAIGMQNRWSDTSPSGTAMVFSLKKLLGDSTVRSTFVVNPKNIPVDTKTAARNLYINVLDASLNLQAFPLSQPKRAYIDFTKGNDDLQRHDDSMKKIIASWKGDVEKEVQARPEIAFHQQLIDRLSKSKADKGELSKLGLLVKEQIESDFDSFESKARDRRESLEGTLTTYWQARYELEILDSKRRRVLADLAKTLSDLGIANDPFK
jgi:hypothetical protein